MTFQQVVFYFFGAVLVFAAAMVVTVRNPVKATLFLVLAFFSAAGLWMLLGAEFLAITLVLVYVGAVMVLFLFVVMMLDINLAALREGFGEYLPIGGLVATLMVIEMAIIVGPRRFGLAQVSAPTLPDAGYSNSRVLGVLLYTKYLYPLEVAAVLLLVAIVAAIALTLRRRAGTRHQDPAAQVRVERNERLRIISMPAERRHTGGEP